MKKTQPKKTLSNRLIQRAFRTAAADWLWRGRLAVGALSILAGQASGGKGLVTMDVAARVTPGRDWPDGAPAGKIGDVLLISGEDDPKRVMRPRLEAAGADVSRVLAGQTVLKMGKDGKMYRHGFSLSDVPELEVRLKQLNECRLVVIDPIGDFIGGRTQTDKDNQVRAVMQPIAALAEKFRVAVLIVAHYRKSESFAADDKVMGSRGFTAIARNVWHIMPDPDNGRRLMLAGKSNLAAAAPGLAFTVGTGTVPRVTDPVPFALWAQEAIQMTADEWIASQHKQDGQPGPKPERKAEAESFLANLLAERIIVPASEAFALATSQGITEKTLKRAKADLRVMSWRDGEGLTARWVWTADQSSIIAAIISAP